MYDILQQLTHLMHSVLQIWMKVCTKKLEVLMLIKIPYDLEQGTQVIHSMFVII